MYRTQSLNSRDGTGTDDIVDFDDFTYDGSAGAVVTKKVVTSSEELPNVQKHNKPKQTPWDDIELKSCLKLYLRMLEYELKKETYSKAKLINLYRQTELSRRTKGSIEFRLQNFSSLFIEKGWPTVVGFKPLPHLGTNIKNRINLLLEDIKPAFDPFNKVTNSAAEQDSLKIADPNRLDTQTITPKKSPPVMERPDPATIVIDFFEFEDEEILQNPNSDMDKMAYSLAEFDIYDEWDEQDETVDETESAINVDDIFGFSEPIGIPDLLSIDDIKSGHKVATLLNAAQFVLKSDDKAIDFFDRIIADYPRHSSFRAILRLLEKGITFEQLDAIWKLKKLWTDSFSYRCQRHYNKQQRAWTNSTQASYGKYQMTWVLGAQLLSDFEYEELEDAMDGHWFEEWSSLPLSYLDGDNLSRNLFYSYSEFLRSQCKKRMGYDIYKNRRRNLLMQRSEHDLLASSLNRIRKEFLGRNNAGIPVSNFATRDFLNV